MPGAGWNRELLYYYVIKESFIACVIIELFTVLYAVGLGGPPGADGNIT